MENVCCKVLNILNLFLINIEFGTCLVSDLQFTIPKFDTIKTIIL